MFIRKQKYPKPNLIAALAVIIFTIFLFPLTTQAGEKEAKEIKEQQQKLKQLTDEISKAQDERNQQKAKLDKINNQMKCDWALLKAYDACESQNKDNPEKQLECKVKAKQEAKKCLSTAEEEKQ